MFLGKGVLKICCKFTGEHPCRSMISIKLQNKHLFIRTSLEGCFCLIIAISSSSFQNTKNDLIGFHKIAISVLKQIFQRSSSKELVYRDYKNFDRLTFKRELEETLRKKWSFPLRISLVNVTNYAVSCGFFVRWKIEMNISISSKYFWKYWIRMYQ